jgi:hypothetical protein
MKRLLLAAAMCVAAPAYAQQPDELCASLDKVLAAAKPAELPFGALAKDGKTPVDAAGKHPSFYSVDKPPGLADAKTCRVDNAGSIYGSATNKATDTFECELVDISESDDPQGDAKAKAAGEAMTARIKACLTPKGWTAAPAAFESGGRDRTTIWKFTHAGQKPVVEVQFNIFASGRTKIVEQYTTKLFVTVEVPNKYKPVTPATPPKPN